MKERFKIVIMGCEGTAAKFMLKFVTILLIHKYVNSQRLPDISDLSIEFSYTDGQLDHIKQRRDVGSDLFKYIVLVEVNMSQVILIEEIKTSLESISLPFQVSNTTEIASFNITTVCYPVDTKYQCICEDQYVWSTNNCIAYETCGNVTAGPCSCISAIPSDGEMCVPKSEIPFFDFLVDIEMDATNTVMDEVRTFLGGISFPVPLDIISELKDMDFTTVCLPNNTGYECRCEDQYFWSCDTCLASQHCDDVINGTCGCISAVPNDGQFCQPMEELNSSCPNTTTKAPSITKSTSSTQLTTSTTIVIPTLSTQLITTIAMPTSSTQLTTSIRKSPPATTSTRTTTTAPTIANIIMPPSSTQMSTTIRSPPPATTSRHTTPTEIHKPTNPTMITTTTTTTTTTASTTPSTAASTQSTTASTYVILLSLKINKQFDLSYNDPNDENYKNIKNIIINSVEISYKTVSAYVHKSVMVTKFRPGSVIADYSITARNANPDLVSANKQLFSYLNEKGIGINGSEFAKMVENGIIANESTVYPGGNVTLQCNILINNNGIIWTKDGNTLDNSDQYTIDETERKLTVINVNSANSGDYSCRLNVTPVPYVAVITIKVYPNANLQTSSDKVVNCSDTTLSLQCCVDTSYTINASTVTTIYCTSKDQRTGCITCYYNIQKLSCQGKDYVQWFTCQAIGSDRKDYAKKTFWITATNNIYACDDEQYGKGNETKIVDCTEYMVGTKTVECQASKWIVKENNCILRVIQTLIDRAQTLLVSDIPQITADLRRAAIENSQIIMQSPTTVLGIVGVLQQIAIVSQITPEITKSIMTDFLKTVEVIISKDAENTWNILNTNITTRNTSSILLNSTEKLAQKLSNVSFEIITNTTHLKRTNISLPYLETFQPYSPYSGQNLTTQIFIPENSTAFPLASKSTFFTFIVFSSLNTALSVQDATNNASQTNASINGDVVVIRPEKIINKIFFNFSLLNNSLGNPQCVFWNFALFDGMGGWDSTGCELKSFSNQSELVSCECNHTTSFSVLMSPYFQSNVALAYITYIGVSISLASLILCLIIETIIWKAMTRNDTSYMRHVSIVNIALSLLIADICFIIGASIVQPGEKTPVGPCSAVTFFIHFFYLVLFFWMLLSALLLFYRTVMVFSGMSRSRMMAISFTVGYGAPLLIAVITVASTAGNEGYVQEKNTCWLNWDKTKALLAFVIPALTIVVINLLVLIVVIYKMLRRGVGASSQPDEKHALVVIARCVGILTPLFGLTWGFGIGTMFSKDLGIHVVFAFLNSLQGFFILVFGTLLDSKIREALAGRLSLANISSNRTRSTSAGPSSSSGLPILRTRRRNGYITAEGNDFSALSTSNSDTFRNI